jgi:hypothetical protein
VFLAIRVYRRKKSMRENSSSVRKVVLVGFLVTIVTFALAVNVRSAEAVAGPNVCAYYSDATYTTVVGARGTGCCGAVINWGITTAFKKCERLLCTDQICPN